MITPLPFPVTQTQQLLADFMVTNCELAWASAQTISYRLALLSNVGLMPSSWQQRESMRMVSEKAAAAQASTWTLVQETSELERLISSFITSQGALTAATLAFGNVATLSETVALQQRYVKASQDSLSAASELWLGWLGTAGKGLQPYHQRATANAKRLQQLSSKAGLV